MTAAKNFDPKVLVGKSLEHGRYLLKEYIDQGSFAFVYRAEETLGGQKLRDVAVKWVFECDTPTILREAQALAAMPSHANIVGFLTTIVVPQPLTGLMLVLEFAEGKSMDKLIADGRARSPDETLRMMSDILHGLAHAHSHKVIHRDLKPDNVVARADGLLKITDFGIAASNVWSTEIAGYRWRGTPAYMAPEQFGPEHDHRVDLYAAGVMTYELLLGCLPFYGSSQELKHAHQTEEAPLPDGMPPSLAAFLRRALAKDPKQRFDTATRMLEALEDAVIAAAGRNASLPDQAGRARDSQTARRRNSSSAQRILPAARGSRQPPVVRTFADAAPPAEWPWPAATDTRSISAAIATVLPGARQLGMRAAADLKVQSARRWPVWRVARKSSNERRSVSERYDLYNNERLPKPEFESPSEIDPWDPSFSVERPTPRMPATLCRVGGSERKVRCPRCRGRGRSVCGACGGKNSAKCATCSGKPEVECAACSGMGDLISYLVIETWFETREIVRLVKGSGLTVGITPEEFAAASPTSVFHASGTLLELTDLPAKLPWSETRAAVKELFAAEPPADVLGISDEVKIDWVGVGHADCTLAGQPVAIEAIPEVGLAKGDERFPPAVAAWVRQLLADDAAWDREPARMVALGRELLEGPKAAAWNDAVQKAALSLAKRLLESGQTAAYRELRKPLGELLGLDKKGTWKAEWTSMLAARRRALSQKFTDALAALSGDVQLSQPMEQLAELGAFAEDSAGLLEASLAKVRQLVKRNDFEHSDPLVRALSQLTWPSAEPAKAFSELTLKALKEQAAALEAAAKKPGSRIEPLFAGVRSLLAVCPDLPAMPALLRAVRERVVAEMLEGDLSAGFHWSQKLHEEVSLARRDLAGLFAKVLEGNEEAYVAALNRIFGDPKRFSEALELLTVPDVQATDDPRLGELAVAFNETFQLRCESDYWRLAQKGPLPEKEQAELERAMIGWARLESWSVQRSLEATFVPQLWQVINLLLRISPPETAKRLLDLTGQLACVRDHIEYGSVLAAALDAERHGAAICEALRDGRVHDFAKGLDLLLGAVPKHPASIKAMTELEAHFVKLAREGRVWDLHDEADEIRVIHQNRNLALTQWIRDPINEQSSDIEEFLVNNCLDLERLPDVLRTMSWLRSHNIRWVHHASSRVDGLLGCLEDKKAISRLLALVPAADIAAAADPRSTLYLMTEQAREGLDNAISRVSLAVILPLALGWWPAELPWAGVQPVQGTALTGEIVVSWLCILVASLILSAHVPHVARAVMKRIDRKARLWLPLALVTGAVASVFAFSAGHFAAWMLAS